MIKIIVTGVHIMVIIIFGVCRWANDSELIAWPTESMAWSLIFDMIEEIRKILHRHNSCVIKS